MIVKVTERLAPDSFLALLLTLLLVLFRFFGLKRGVATANGFLLGVLPGLVEVLAAVAPSWSGQRLFILFLEGVHLVCLRLRHLFLLVIIGDGA